MEGRRERWLFCGSLPLPLCRDAVIILCTRRFQFVFLEMKKQVSLPNLEPKGDSKTSVTFQKTKTLIRGALRQRTERDDFHFLDRWQQAVVMRLRTCHSRLNGHMFRKMKLAPPPTCNCGLEDQTAEHILQRCPLLQTARTNVWPTAVQLYTHQTLRQQRRTGDDSHTHLADWTLSVAAIEKK